MKLVLRQERVNVQKTLLNVRVGCHLHGMRIESVEFDWQDIRALEDKLASDKDRAMDWLMDLRHAMVRSRDA